MWNPNQKAKRWNYKFTWLLSQAYLQLFGSIQYFSMSLVLYFNENVWILWQVAASRSTLLEWKKYTLEGFYRFCHLNRKYYMSLIFLYFLNWKKPNLQYLTIWNEAYEFFQEYFLFFFWMLKNWNILVVLHLFETRFSFTFCQYEKAINTSMIKRWPKKVFVSSLQYASKMNSIVEILNKISSASNLKIGNVSNLFQSVSAKIDKIKLCTMFGCHSLNCEHSNFSSNNTCLIASLSILSSVLIILTLYCFFICYDRVCVVR